MRAAPLLALMVLGLSAVVAAQLGSPGTAQRYERAVKPGAAGPNRLALDGWTVQAGQPFSVRSLGTAAGAEGTTSEPQRVFVGIGGLGDLRLFDAANRAVPYLLVPPEQPVANWVRGELQPLVATKTTSGFELTLPQAVRVDRLRLEGLPSRFLKKATVEGSGDREHWTALAPQATVFDLPDDKLKQLVVAFTPGDYRYLRVTWDDRSSGRLPLPAMVMVREAAAVPAAEPLRVPVEVLKRSSEPGRSRYQLTLPATRMPVTDLEVVASDKHILRLAHITEAQLSGDQLKPLELGSATLRRASREEDDASAADLRVPVVAPSSARLELMIEDGSNQALDIQSVVAVLAPLPWIYFESADGGAITARLGDRKATPPSYDLEAVRPNLAKMTTMATATWGDPPATTTSAPTPPLESGAGGAASAGATMDTAEFRYSRDVPSSPSGLTTLTLDAAVLAHSRLSDLRLVDHDKHQQAYILESRDEPLTLLIGNNLAPASAPDWLRDELKNAPSGNRTLYRLALPYDTWPASKLVLATGTHVFTRQIAVFVRWEPAPGRDRPAARRIASRTWAHADPEDAPPALTMELPEVQSSELVLMVDEGDNAPLPIATAQLLLPGYQIRFLRLDDTQPLTLFYGDPTLSTPRYDLALMKPYLLDAPAGEVDPGPERERVPATQAAHLPAWGFWAVLVVAVLVLLGLIGRLLRSESASVEHPSP